MTRMGIKKDKKILRDRIPVIQAGPESGLTDEQAQERARAGYANLPVDPPTRTVWQIIAANIFTYFNMLFFALGLCVAAVREWQNLTFLGVVLCNAAVGIVQELRSKRMLDKLTLLSAPKTTVIRNGQERTVGTADLVRDDIVQFSMGDQICADAEVVSGVCQVNEALITGEADEIKKTVGDKLLSGSFLVNGSCRARLTAVGADSFASQLTLAAKAQGKRKKSEMMNSLEKLVKWIGFIVIPFGVIMFIKEYMWLDRDVASGVTSTVASIIGMIPEGLYLLTSIALVAGVARLARERTLCHEMECIETLARVDTLCVDKTGTITENKMAVEDIVSLNEERFTESDIRAIMADFVFAMKNDNDTMAALRRYFTGEVTRNAATTLPFSSSKKYSGVSFGNDGTYILGAPEVVLGESFSLYADRIEHYSAAGCRVLVLVLYDGALEDEALDKEMLPVSLILLTNKIRAEAPDTFEYFERQGVSVKVISGDNPMAVSEVARRAGIKNAEKYVDARELRTYMQIKNAAAKYTVYGRVTPEQKFRLIRAMKEAGHIVAMTGDGVNDVLALKEADCSVAMASGSEVACQVANIVLLDSDFSAMPSVVGEGRRVINNIERSASLYLVKNIFTFLLAAITLIFTMPYPFDPSQLSLISAVTIGIPSFVLAMEPNRSLVKGRFLLNVISRALPAALTDLVLILCVLMLSKVLHFDELTTSTIATGVMGAVGLVMVHRTSKPYNLVRKIMITAVAVMFCGGFFLFRDFFSLTILSWKMYLILLGLSAAAWPIMAGLDWCIRGSGTGN